MISFRGAVDLLVCTNEKKKKRKKSCTFRVFAEMYTAIGAAWRVLKTEEYA